MPISLASAATASRSFSTSAANACSAAGSPSATSSIGIAAVKISLQDKLCGDLVAYAFMGARPDAGLGQRRGSRVSGEALVDELRGQAEAALELLREAA